MRSFPGASKRRVAWSSFLLSLTFLVLLSPPADARVVAQIGVGDCGAKVERATPGSTIRVRACFTRDGVPTSGELAVFVEHGPVATDVVVTAISSSGDAVLDLVAPSEGVSLISSCIASVCTPPLRLVWSDDEEQPSQTGHPPMLAPPGSTADLKPKVEGFAALATAPGKKCLSGEVADVPSFIDIIGRSTRAATHPRSGKDVTSHVVATGSPVLPGSVIYRADTVVAIVTVEGSSPLDDSGSPLDGANRVFAFWSTGDSRIGKFELAYDGRRWIDVPASFTVTAQDNEVEFFPDDKPIAGRTVAFARAEGGCDSTGTLASEAPPLADRGAAVGAGVLILALMAGLTLAILRSSEPPSKGIVVDQPAGPPVRFERSDVIYDAMGRALRFVDIVETPDGATHTIRGSIAQEALVLEAPDLLDPSDWEDETLRIERTDMRVDNEGRLISFWESVSSLDGTSQRAHIHSVQYGEEGRVTRFERSIESLGIDDPLSSRTEIVTLLHEGSSEDAAGSPSLCAGERLHRSELRYDAEGHVIGAVCTTVTDGTGEISGVPSARRIEVPVPQPMWWAGVGFPDVTAALSAPNKGISRLRHVLTRWFRVHGCRVTLVVADSLGNPLADLPIKFGGHMSHVDRKGHQTFWVLTTGNYAVSTVEGFLARTNDADVDGGHDRFMEQGLIGWVCVRDVPGTAEARFVVALPPTRSRVGDQP